MRNPFNFEAEPFELDSEFDEFDEGQSAGACRCNRHSKSEYESDFEGGPFEIDPEFDESELYDEYSDPESFEAFKPRICKAGLEDLGKLRQSIDNLKSELEGGSLDNIEYYSKEVIKQGNLIKTRLKNGWYKRKGCTATDLDSIKKLKTTR